ncbi:MAG: hypothetical protein Q8P18_12350 [Pseudomonadota bacterium]|nr:hypothetical protein [Pseudomonadota bacterium]
MLAFLALFIAPGSALASMWSPEDLVSAHARGLSADTTARMAESVGIDSATAVYLLRRGVSAEALAPWGYEVGAAERGEAELLGALVAPSRGVSDADWSEMAELPTGIERAGGGPVSGLVLTVVPELAVIRTRDASVLVDRADARDVWVDARPIDAIVNERGSEDVFPGPAPRVTHLRRGRAGVVAGALFAVVGGVAFASGAKGATEGYVSRQSCCFGAMNTYTVQQQVATSPNLWMVGLGGVGLLGAGLSFHFGAQELRLAGAYPAGWTPSPDDR